MVDRLLADLSPQLRYRGAALHVIADAGFLPDAAAALDGVRDIPSERWAEDAALVGAARLAVAEGLIARRGARRAGSKAMPRRLFRDYFDYDEPMHGVPSHRALAVRSADARS